MSWLTIVRDLLIIFVALGSLVAIGLIIYFVMQCLALVRIVREQVPQVLDSTRQTTGAVAGTVGFISDRAVTPILRGASISAAVIRFCQVLFRGAPRRRL